jgi:hypothetical protein
MLPKVIGDFMNSFFFKKEMWLVFCIGKKECPIPDTKIKYIL